MIERAEEPEHFAFLLLPGFALMSYSSAIEPLRAANVLAGRTLYRWTHLSPDGHPVAASNGLAFPVDAGIGDVPDAGTLLVCAGGNPAEFEDAATFAFLRAAARRGIRIGGVSAGPFILAQAGLLDGRRATVHWEHAPAFAECFPAVTLLPSLYQVDGARLTCAGGVAALDMMHAVIAERHGAALARRVGDWFLAAHVRAGGGGQRLSVAERFGIRNRRLEIALETMEARLEDLADREEIAAAAGVSLRQLDRLFAEQLGTSAERFYLQLRLDRARDLLRQSAMPVTEIALACGFASASHFSRAFKARFGASPRAFR